MARRHSVLASFLLAVIFSVVVPHMVSAQSAVLTVTPIVIDDKAKVRDILKKSITVTNSSDRKLNLYPVVNDVNAASGTEEFISAQSGPDRSDSLANWIELSRGVIDLSPGETREIPFVIRVNLNAIPNTYHADISFYEGSTLADAQQKNPLAVVTVNTEVQADIKESMQLNKFVTDNFFFSGDDILFNYQLENIGNQELKPKGEIRIYDRRGTEVASIPVNPEGRSFTPDQAAQLASAWSAAQGFGKFKAFLNIDYGNNQAGSLQDTVFFWIIPWQQLLAIVVASLIAIIASALYFHRWLEHRHMQKFALAGLGSAGALSAPAGMLVEPTQRPSEHVMTMPAAPVVTTEKRGLFARFRRTKSTPIAEAVVSEAPTQVPVAAVVPTQPEHVQPAPRVETMSAQSDPRTIDLGTVQMAKAPARRESHVINLKNSA